MTALRGRTAMRYVLGTSLAVTMVGLGLLYGVIEWTIRRNYDAPMVALRASAPDLAAGMHMARVVGCWAGCHGKEGEGGIEWIDGLHKSVAPTLSQVIPQYTDEELVRLIRYGVKRDGKSAIGMISYTFWPLGDQDLVNIIAHLRRQPVRAPVPRKVDIQLGGRIALLTGKWKVSAEQVDHSIPRWGELPRETAFERGRYLASITCWECHGLDFKGNRLEGGPSLAVIAGYTPVHFRDFLRTAKSVGGREISKMNWVREVDFSDQEIDDIYVFLREYHGLPVVHAVGAEQP